MSETLEVSDLPKLPAVSTGRRTGVRWDEANLEANEEIKKDLNPTRITEPKTPYLSPIATDDECDADSRHMVPVELENVEGSQGQHHTAQSPHRTATHPASILISALGDDHHHREGSGWSDSDRSTPARSPKMSGRSPRFSNDTTWGDEDLGSADPERLQKRQKFKEARKQHYNLKMSLKEAHELIELEEEQEEGKGDPEVAGEVDQGLSESSVPQ